jgi:hypothetical protein
VIGHIALLKHASELIHACEALLEQPGSAARVEANVRRAASSAYYALFHMLADDGASETVLLDRSEIHPRWQFGARRSAVDDPSKRSELHARVRRAFDHKQMKMAATNVRDWKPSRAEQFPELFGHLPDPKVKQIAAAFVELQASRHIADYDLAADFPWAEGYRLVNLAEQAWKAWFEIRGGSDAAVFLLFLLLGERLKRRG